MTRVAFGTDGIRGPAGTRPIDADVARAVGTAALHLARVTGGSRVVIGRDPRPSGPALAASVAGGVSAGVALDAGVVPTAAVGIAVAEGLADVGVMVTASHNPAADNGFKVLGPGGRKLQDTEVEAVEAAIEAALRAPESASSPARRAPEVGCLWWERVSQRVDPAPLRGRKIAIDFANGAAIVAIPWLIEWLDAEIVVVGAGDGAVNDGCGSEHLQALAAQVRAHGCDGGLAVDGDADRCRLVDERGQVVPGDAVTMRLAVDLGVDAVVVTVMSNGALEGAMPGVAVIRTPVGDRHIAAQMHARGLPLGAEESGHVLFADHPAGDGLLAGLRAMGAAWRSHRTLSEAFARFAPLPRRTGRVVVSERPLLGEVAPLQQAAARARTTLGDGGRVMLRYSGTEPVLRILVEGVSDAAVDAALDAVAEAAEAALR